MSAARHLCCTTSVTIYAVCLLLLVVTVYGYDENQNDALLVDEDRTHFTPYVITFMDEGQFLTDVASRNVPHFVMFYAPWYVLKI